MGSHIQKFWKIKYFLYSWVCTPSHTKISVCSQFQASPQSPLNTWCVKAEQVYNQESKICLWNLRATMDETCLYLDADATEKSDLMKGEWGSRWKWGAAGSWKAKLSVALVSSWVTWSCYPPLERTVVWIPRDDVWGVLGTHQEYINVNSKAKNLISKGNRVLKRIFTFANRHILLPISFTYSFNKCWLPTIRALEYSNEVVFMLAEWNRNELSNPLRWVLLSPSFCRWWPWGVDSLSQGHQNAEGTEQWSWTLCQSTLLAFFKVGNFRSFLVTQSDHHCPPIIV